MKRKVALLLVFMMMVTMILPLGAFAADADNEGLQKAIQIARQKFEVPADLTQFEYNVRIEYDVKVWDLNWSSKGYTGGSMNVAVDENGIIRAYNCYMPEDSQPQGRLPKISRKDAIARADAFIAKVNPSITMKYVDGNESFGVDVYYSFNYVQLINGIPFSGSNSNISVNRDNGKIQSFYCNYRGDLKFTSPDKVISKADAQKAFMDKLGLELAYNSCFDGKTINIFPVYQPKNNFNQAIDAVTGEKVRTDYYYGPYFGGADGRGGMMNYSKESKSESAAAIQLTPEEAKAVEDASKLLSKDAAEAKARAFKEAGITSTYELQYSNLYRRWDFGKDEFIWQFSFTRKAVTENGMDDNASVELNAKTGEIVAFSRYPYFKETDTVTLDEKGSQAIAEQFLTKVNAEKFKQTIYQAYDTGSEPGGLQIGSKPVFYSFNYIRKVNGIPYAGNALNVQVSAVTGAIVSYSVMWWDGEFPAVDKVISLDSAYDKFFSDVGLELQYKTKAINEAYLKEHPNAYDHPETVLVYAPTANKSTVMDAYTGQIVDYSGKPIKEASAVSYSDIQGHYAQSYIETLAQYDITLEGTAFRPDEAITQKDFLTLIAKCTNYYEVVQQPLEKDQKIEDRIYDILLRDGIVKKDEKKPDALITREEAVKYIIRAMHCEKYAELQGIYTLNFSDKAQINPSLVGYVAMAYGMKIIGGVDGKFLPKGNLSRGQAAIIIYRYLEQ